MSKFLPTIVGIPMKAKIFVPNSLDVAEYTLKLVSHRGHASLDTENLLLEFFRGSNSRGKRHCSCAPDAILRDPGSKAL